jgi:hypothetical protein
MVLKRLCAIFYITLINLSVHAQKDSLKKKILHDNLNHVGIGAAFNEFGGNDGAALDITSPYFDMSDSNTGVSFMAFKFTFNENAVSGILPGQTSPSAYRYKVLNLGVVEKKIIVKQAVALFWDFGGTLILPNIQFTSQSNRWGIYELAGVEFYPSLYTGVSFEMGFTETGKLIADKLEGEPYYYINNYFNDSKAGESFLLSVGIHFYL